MLPMKLTAAAVVCAVRFAVPAVAEELVVQLNPADTDVAFMLGSTLHTVHGTFKLRRGEVRFDPATGKASGEVIVDAASGESGNDSRDRKMHKSVLESERYPDIVFTPERVEGKVASQGVSEVQVHGTFAIHGAAHPVVLPVKIEAGPDKITATTQLSVPYIKWGMKNPSTLFLRVSDKVGISIRAVGHLAAGSGAAVSGGGG